MKSIRFGRIIIGGILVPLMSVLLITLIVTIYAFTLAFQAKGAPDQNSISHFAGNMGRSYGGILQIVLTIPASLWSFRKIDAKLPVHGLLIGILASILGMVMSFSLSLLAIGELIVTTGAGWTTGILVQRRRRNRI
jgi:hypothetical protein